MPQMSPLPWLFLMIMFITTLMVMASQMFHSSKPSLPKTSITLGQKNKTWMW